MIDQSRDGKVQRFQELILPNRVLTKSVREHFVDAAAVAMS